MFDKKTSIESLFVLLLLSALFFITSTYSDEGKHRTTEEKQIHTHVMKLKHNLRIQAGTATAVMGVILTCGDALTVLSLAGVIVGGAGIVSAVSIQTAKTLAKKYGRKHAENW